MRLIIKLFLCLCLVPVGAFAQDRTNKVLVGPYNDQVRVLIALVEPSESSYKLQSVIIDVDPVKDGKAEPASFQVDLTTTIRSLVTGEKQQKALVLRRQKSGDLELKCSGKWIKPDASANLGNFVELTRAVIRSVPLNSKTPVEVTLSEDIQQKVAAGFAALETQPAPCPK